MGVGVHLRLGSATHTGKTVGDQSAAGVSAAGDVLRMSLSLKRFQWKNRPANLLVIFASQVTYRAC